MSAVENKKAEEAAFWQAVHECEMVLATVRCRGGRGRGGRGRGGAGVALQTCKSEGREGREGARVQGGR